MFASLAKYDDHYSRALHRSELGALDYVIVVPGMLCSRFGMPVVILMFGLTSGWSALVTLVLSSVGTLAITEPTKKIVGRERPRLKDLGKRRFNIRKLLTNHAFPSGDSAQGAVLTTTLALQYGSGLHLLILPSVMFGRAYYGAHWIGDTVGGAAIGVLTTVCIHYLST